MILYKEKPFECKMKNVMLLDAGPKESDGVLYVSKNTYDQCVMIRERFEGERGVPCKLLGVPFMDGSTVDFFEHAPEPINMLAPFIGMLAGRHEIRKGDWEQMYGYLHMLSQIINFNGYLLIPEGARADVTLSRVVINSYEESWRDLTETLADVVVSSGSMGRQISKDNAEEEEEEPAQSVEEMKSADSFDMDSLNALLAECAAEAEAEVAAENKKKVESAPPMATAPTGGSTLTAEAEKQNSAANDALADMYSEYT